MSADGRFVAFASDASNLVRGDRNQMTDVFIRDRRRGTTTLVSAASSGADGNGRSFAPATSADGRLVAFASEASNIVARDRNAAADVFTWNRRTDRTVRIGVASDGHGADSWSGVPLISADGRIVAFASAARNIAHVPEGSAIRVFLRDIRRRTTTAIESPEPLSDTGSRTSRLTAAESS